jgi:hypothetical protein
MRATASPRPVISAAASAVLRRVPRRNGGDLRLRKALGDAVHHRCLTLSRVEGLHCRDDLRRGAGRGTGVCTAALGAWHPDQELAPGGASAAAALAGPARATRRRASDHRYGCFWIWIRRLFGVVSLACGYL